MKFRIRKKYPVKKENYSSIFSRGKKVLRYRTSVRRLLFDYFLIFTGAISAGFGLKGFLLPNGFIDGGATGISLLLMNISGLNFSLLLILVNLPFIIMGYFSISKDIAIKTTAGISLLGVAVAFFPYPEITNDKILVAVFGGFFLGTGIGLAVRGGGVIDGSEVLAVFLGKKLYVTIGDVILIFNILVFITAVYVLSVEAALYSILTYLAASKTVDFIVEGIEEYTGVTIVSIKSEEIKQMIIEKIKRGVTVYHGESGYGKRGSEHEHMKILYTVVTRLEVRKLNTEIKLIDPNAFVVMHPVKDAIGGMVKRRRHKH